MGNKITTDEIKDYLKKKQGQEVTLSEIRSEFNILAGTESFDAVRNIMWELSDQKLIKPLRRGAYKVVTQIKPVRVFLPGRQRRPIFDLMFPQDANTGMEMNFANAVILREGDLITLGGVKSRGKTTLCLRFCAENIEKHPVLMGNEYTVLVSKKEGDMSSEDIFEPAPRFLSRLDTMAEDINWTDKEGYDKFQLLPVRGDYAEHIIKDKINIIDWINIDAGQLYDIGKVLEEIKSNLGRGIAIVALQKGEGAVNPRGGQFVRDFSDLELLLDPFGQNENDILLTVKGVKEKKEGNESIVGKTYAYNIGGKGTKIFNFREVTKCPRCHGNGYIKGEPCDSCFGAKYVDGESQ